MRKYIFFGLIVLIAVFFRFYKLDSIPPSASLDEASIGYNAYSILQTGADEYGNKFPLLLRAYDDWRPSLYAYLVIPFIKIFGLSIFAVRLPSVILSVLTVISTYFLTVKIFENFSKFSVSFNFLRYSIFVNKVKENVENLKVQIGGMAMFLLAVSPWHIYISRLGHEANAGLAFFIFAITLFLYKKNYYSVFFFILSIVSYQTEKIFIPIILIGILFFYRKSILKLKKKIIIIFLLSLIILAPFIKETLSPNALIRFEATNIFKSQPERFNKQSQKLLKAVENNDVIGTIIYNRRVLMAQIFIEGYVSHFNPQWLFLNPSDDRHKIPGLGLMYLWEVPFITMGFFFFVFGKIDSRIKKLILLWFFSAPIAASLTTDAPHAMRSYVFLPLWQIFTATGLIYVLNFYKNIKFKLVVSSLFGLVILISIYYLFVQYFLVFPNTQSKSFQYPLSKAIFFVLEHEKSYNKIVFSNEDNLYQSYMFYLFYSRYNPFVYQKQGGTKSGGYAEAHNFDKYFFMPIRHTEENKDNKILFIGNLNDFSNDSIPLKTFSDLSGEKRISVVEQE